MKTLLDTYVQPVHFDSPICLNIVRLLRLWRGYAVAQLVNTLPYKPEGLIFEFDRTMAVGLTQVQTAMTTRSICREINAAEA